MPLANDRVRFVARFMAQKKPSEWAALDEGEKKNWVLLSRRALRADERFQNRHVPETSAEEDEEA